MTAVQPQGGPLAVTADRILVMGGAVPLRIDFAGVPDETGGRPLPPPPVDLLVLVDVSGSTRETRPTLLAAIESAANDLLLSGASANRVAVVSFDTEARIEADWTASADRVSARALAPLLDRSGANDSRAMFREIDSVMARARPQARRLAVFYTDGEWVACSSCPNPMGWPEVIGASQALRGNEVELFVVGVPNSLDIAHMSQVTGSPGRTLIPTNQSEITAQFRSVTTTDDGIAAHRARLALPMDGRLFDVVAEDGGWSVGNADGRLARRIQPLRRSPAMFAVTVRPNILGYVPVTYAPAQLRYPKPDGTGEVELRSGTPSILVVSPLFLAVAFAPALGWAALALLSRPKEEPPPPPSDSIPKPPPPPVQVLRLPVPASPAEAAVPTLIVGVGGWGGRAALAVRRHLTATAGGNRTPPVGFIAVDVDSDALSQALAAQPGSQDFPVTALTAPVAVTDANQWLRDRIPDSARPGTVWSGLPLRKYQGASRQELSLERGVHGDRTLGRAALLRWFEHGGLAEALQDGLQALMARPAADGVRQIVVLLDTAGGFGSAAALDIARVLRRQARAAQAAGVIIPEILCIAAEGGAGAPERARRTAFLRECETASRLPCYPRTVLLGSARPELAATDDEAPFDTVMTVSGAPDDAIAQTVVLCDTLLSPRPRRAWLPAMARSAGPVAAVTARGLTVPAATEHRLTEQEFLLRVIGWHLLGGITPAPDGSGYDVPAPSAERLSNLVAQIRAAEPPASPWAMLLRAAAEPQELPAFLAMVPTLNGGAPEWITRSAAASLTAMLCPASGQPPGNSITPVEVAALSEWLAQRIAGPLAGEASGLGAAPDAVAVLQTLAKGFSVLSDSWRGWTGRLLSAASETAAESARLRAATAPSASALAILSDAADDEGIGRRLDEAFTVWLREHGPNANLRSHLSFAVVVENGTPAPVLRSRIGHRADHRDPDAAIAMLRRAAAPVAGLVGHRQIAGVLATVDAGEARRLAETLIAASRPAAGTLLVRPSASDRAAEATIVAFSRTVVEPAGCPPRLEATAYGHATMARISWAAPLPSRLPSHTLPVVQPLDLTAERLRLRLSQFLDRQIDDLPPALALAAADPDRFRSFARLYRGGCLSERPDPWGRMSWFLSEPGVFLTQGDPSLAAAAAVFVRSPPVPEVSERPESGDFSVLDAWTRSHVEPNADAGERLLTLAAISIALEEEVLA
ncbi:VWA domain-containing protein [Azospirillum humicireducens]|nr:VWA domain-containing protein [Azospirillum humicireducens]